MKPWFRAATAALMLVSGLATAQVSDEERAFLDSLRYEDGLVMLPEAMISV